jgi:hypothetical protein
MLWDSLLLFAVAAPLLLAAIFFLIRPLDRIKPLLQAPREYCNGDGIRSVMGQFGGKTVKFTTSPFRPRFFSMTVYHRGGPAPEQGWGTPIVVTASGFHPADADASHLFTERQRETLKILFGPLAFDRLEVGKNKLVLSTRNPSSGMFSRTRVRHRVLRTLDLLRTFADHSLSDHSPGPYSELVLDGSQLQGDKP